MVVRRALAVAIGAALVLGGCTDDADEGSPDAGTAATVDPARLEALADSCRRNAPEGTDTDRCDEVVAAVVEQVGDAGCGFETVAAVLEVAMASELAVLPSDGFVERCPASLSSLIVEDVPDDYAPLLPGQPEVGMMSADALASLYVEADRWREFLDDSGYLGGVSRHWTIEETDADSLVVRLDRFATIVGAFGYSNPAGDDPTADTVPGALDARLVRSELPPEVVDRFDYTTLPHQQRITGRVCDVVITVMARSADAPREPDELVELFERQAQRVSAAVIC